MVEETSKKDTACRSHKLHVRNDETVLNCKSGLTFPKAGTEAPQEAAKFLWGHAEIHFDHREIDLFSILKGQYQLQ
jgi:hypothetical protein